MIFLEGVKKIKGIVTFDICSAVYVTLIYLNHDFVMPHFKLMRKKFVWCKINGFVVDQNIFTNLNICKEIKKKKIF